MSWSKQGATHLAKVIQLTYNGQIHLYCHNNHEMSEAPRLTWQWLEQRELEGTAFPAMEGQHAGRTWVKVIRAIAQDTNLQN